MSKRGGKRGVILLGHGSRAPESDQVVHEVAQIVAEKIGVPCREAFLAFSRPTLAEAVAEMAAEKVERVIVAPFFILNGVHVQEDIPAALAEEEAKYGGQLEIVFAASFGADARLADIVVDRIQEVS